MAEFALKGKPPRAARALNSSGVLSGTFGPDQSRTVRFDPDLFHRTIAESDRGPCTKPLVFKGFARCCRGDPSRTRTCNPRSRNHWVAGQKSTLFHALGWVRIGGTVFVRGAEFHRPARSGFQHADPEPEQEPEASRDSAATRDSARFEPSSVAAHAEDAASFIRRSSAWASRSQIACGKRCFGSVEMGGTAGKACRAARHSCRAAMMPSIGVLSLFRTAQQA